MTESILNRAHILMQQKKYAEAEKLLNDLLSSNPVDVTVLTLLSEVSLQQDKFEKAETLVDSAIGIAPYMGHLFYIKARIAIQKDKYDEAENYIQQALSLTPDDADYFSLWASVKLARKQFDKALELANKSLEHDPENTLGLNVRSTALIKLNRADDAYKTIEGALRDDPNNAYTHANYGWNLLERGDHKKALEHFKEALKNDPNSTYAQAGMVEALKASNLFYKLFLKYSFWIGNLTAKYQWGVILGFYFGTKLLNSLSRNNEALQPYLTPLVVLLALIAFSTWVMQPLSNLFLRLNKYGKHLLSKKEILSSNIVGISFIIFLVGGISYFLTRNNGSLGLIVFGFSMMLPYSVMFSPTKYKNALVIYAVVMTIIGIASVAVTFASGNLFNAFTPIYVIGFVAFQWAANFLLIKQSNR